MIKYIPFDRFVLRTPILSLDFLSATLDQDKLSDETVIKLLENEIIRESIFLASPSFSKQIEKFLENKLKESKKKEKLKLSFLKYLSRMSTRCTPYGLFAGCSVGKISNETEIILDNISKYKRKTRLDMNFLVALSMELSKIGEIRNKLRFFPNSSIYKVGEKLRYVEYYYEENRRLHDIVAVEWSVYLDKVIKNSKNGLKLQEIVDLIEDEEITRLEASEFVDELVANQILISELEPTVSGPEFLHHIIRILKENFDEDYGILDFLINIEDKLTKIDNNFGNSIRDYKTISDLIKDLQLSFDLNYLFQCDLTIATNRNQISSDLVKDVEKAISLLMRISRIKTKTYLEKFKESFYERYEEHEMPLSVVLDPEVGIGYGRNVSVNDESPLLEGLYIPRTKRGKNDFVEINWTEIDHILQNKITDANKNNLYVIELNDEDFSSIKEAPIEEFPETLSVIIELASVNNKSKIKLHGGGGSSAANLLARFSHGDYKIKKIVEEILEIESDWNKHKLLAEIVHLPESRVGNILSRPDFRQYEIPYLAGSNKNIQNQIEIDDIGVSIRNGKIFLRSKSRNKEILPRLTNAHNYSKSNSLPIYHFLSDVQTEYSPRAVYLDLSSINALYKFIPRIEYRNVIVSYATWNLNASDFEKLKESINNEDLFRKNIIRFQEKFSIPDFFVFSEGDNDLYVNLNNITSMKMFIDSLKNIEFIKLNEFIFSDKKQVVKDIDGNSYANEIILSFYKKS